MKNTQTPESLRASVRAGIPAIDATLTFESLSRASELPDDNSRDTAALGIFHGTMIFALPIIGAEFAKIHYFDRKGCIALARLTDSLIRDVTTDALELDVFETEPVQAAVATLQVYARACK